MDVTELCQKWGLKSADLLAVSPQSQIFKVEFEGMPAVLKIGSLDQSSAALKAFDGKSAVRLLKDKEGAQLLEWIDGSPLKSLVAQERDADATKIVCSTLMTLHGCPAPSGLPGLEQTFAALFKVTDKLELFKEGTKVAEELIASETDVRLLHGDLHHDNIVESSTRGWLSLDPRGLVAERTFDVACTFYNPRDYASVYEDESIIEQRCVIFERELALDRERIFKFAFAYGCLSAAWSLEDGDNPKRTLQTAARILKLSGQ